MALFYVRNRRKHRRCLLDTDALATLCRTPDDPGLLRVMGDRKVSCPACLKRAAERG